MKLADLKNLFGNKNKFNLEEEIKTLLLNWRHDHDYYNGMLEKTAADLQKLTAVANLDNPTQEEWETYRDLMGTWDLLYSLRRTSIEVFGINIARLHYDHGIAPDQLHQAMQNVFDEIGIAPKWWANECFEPHSLVASMIIFEGYQRWIATFIDEKTYEEACSAVAEMLGDGTITKARAIHAVSVIRRCYESHARAKELLAQQQEAMTALKDLITGLVMQQAANDKGSHTIH